MPAGAPLTATFTTGPPPPAPPPPPPPPPRALSPSGTASVATAAALRAAAADPSVSVILVKGSLALDGQPILVQGARSLTVSSGASCGAACSIDAASQSRHFEVRGGAFLTLTGLVLLNGAAVEGGSVLVVGAGSSLLAAACTFANSTSVGDGGAIAAVGSASVVLQSSAWAEAAARDPSSAAPSV